MQIGQFSGIGHLLIHFRPMLYITVKPDIMKYVKNTFGRVSDLNLSLKYHSSEGVFHILCYIFNYNNYYKLKNIYMAYSLQISFFLEKIYF